MQTAFGPTSFGIYYGSAVSDEATSGGPLSITWLMGNDNQATFEAVLGTTTVTPEPGTLMLFGSGLLGLPYLLRRKRSA
jgi:hypothetical protein